MPVTTSYSIGPHIGYAPVATYDDEPSSSSSVTALAGGGFAVVAQDADGYSDLSIYGSGGGLIATGMSVRVTEARLTQLGDGNILLVGIDPEGTTQYETFSPTGQIVDAGVAVNRSGGMTALSNLIATGDSGFVYAGAQTVGASTDIDEFYRNSSTSDGSGLIAPTLENGDPSIVQLTDGNYAIAWDTEDGSGYNLSYQVYSPITGAVKTVLNFDATGSLNSQPSVTALANGDFTITYQDNGYSTGGTGQSDITEAVFAANGTLLTSTRLDSLVGNDSQPVSITLPNGLILTGFTNADSGDIQMSLYDPVNNVVLADNLTLATGGATNLSLAGLANGYFAASYTLTNGGLASSQVGTEQVIRTSHADNLGDTIVGDSMTDWIFGGAGNDNFTGGDGADNLLEGGLGYDTANFSGPRADYTITQQALRTFVKRPDGGTDDLSSIEKLHFADGDVYVPAPVRDLDWNGASDMLLQSSTGAVRVWSMSGGAIIGNALTSMTPSAAYSVVGTGQFNFYVDNYDDILLQNTNGSMVIWEMDGDVVAGTVSLGNLSNVWKAVTTGDFNGDGNADILLQNSMTGQLDIWLMNGTTATTKATVGGAIGTSWHAIATGDFNDDGKSDIVLQNTGGQIDIWTMNGTAVSTAALAGTAGSGWIVRSAGDFNGDGNADLLLQNAAGQVAVWEMNGSTVTSKTVVGTVATAFTVTGTGDFNSDGYSDITFQNTNGAVAEWLMDGTTVTSKVNLGNPGSAWHMVAGTGG